MTEISLDDWRIVDAIASTGTTGSAARLLGLNQSTVFRRVTRLEDELGVRLFDRDQRGFRLTTEGESLLPDIRRLQEVARDIERRAAGLDERPVGEVRLSVNVTVLRYLLAEALEDFQAEHPHILVHLDLTDRLVDLREREADLVIRGSNDPDPDLFGRRLMRLHFAVYASAKTGRRAALRRAFAKDPASLPWILWRGDLLATTAGRWMRTTLGEASPVMTSTSVQPTADLAAAGIGCALLPRFLGDRHPGIVRITDNIEGLLTDLWVLTHQDLRRTARVSKLLAFIGRAINQSNELPASAGRMSR